MRYVPKAPITMVSRGSAQAVTMATGGFVITHARFPAGTVLERHTHEHAILAVMLSGSFDLAMLGRSAACTPQTVFTEPAGEAHENRIGSRGAIVVVIQPAGVRDLPRACVRLFDSASHFRNGWIAALAGRVTHDLRLGDDLARMSAEGHVLELLGLASRLRAEQQPTNPPAWVERVHALINDCFLDGVDIAAIAREADLHPAHVARAFRTWYGMSPARYIRQLRLQWAAGRLVRTRDSIASIAHRAGFSDQSHFTRAFHEYSGSPPALYRRRCGGTAASSLTSGAPPRGAPL